jgi:hypothetical protein
VRQPVLNRIALQEIVWVFTCIPSGQGFASRRLIHAAVVALRPGCGAPHQGVSGPSRPELASPGRPGLAWAVAPHTSGPHLQSRESPARIDSAVEWSSLLRESRRRGHRDFASRGGPLCNRATADGEDCLSRVSAKPEDTASSAAEPRRRVVRSSRCV